MPPGTRVVSDGNQNGFAKWLKCSKVINKQTNKQQITKQNKKTKEPKPLRIKWSRILQKTEFCLIYNSYTFT